MENTEKLPYPLYLNIMCCCCIYFFLFFLLFLLAAMVIGLWLGKDSASAQTDLKSVGQPLKLQ